jgi:hypothetical protein
MNSWELIFIQSRANNGWYDEDALPTYVWAWPKETWLKKRLRDLRSEEKERDGWPIGEHAAESRGAEGPAPSMNDNGVDRLSLVPLLLAEADIPVEARRRYGLTCADAGALTDVAAY